MSLSYRLRGCEAVGAQIRDRAAAHLANVERAEAFTSAVLEHLGQEVPV
jgi:hypothetical protein